MPFTPNQSDQGKCRLCLVLVWMNYGVLVISLVFVFHLWMGLVPKNETLQAIIKKNETILNH